VNRIRFRLFDNKGILEKAEGRISADIICFIEVGE